MITAIKARELAEIAIKKEIETREKRAMAFCNDLECDINNACAIGKREITVHNIPDGLRAYVSSICQDNGYTVTYLNKNTIQLIW